MEEEEKFEVEVEDDHAYVVEDDDVGEGECDGESDSGTLHEWNILYSSWIT